MDFAHGHLNARSGARTDVDLAAATDGSGGYANLYGGIDIGHAKSLQMAECGLLP
jgi:hypothetical protein